MSNLRSPYPVGRIGKLSMDALLDRILMFIYERTTPQTVTLDLNGRIKVRSPSSAMPDESVGTYSQFPCREELRSMIKEDLEDNIKTRGITGERVTAQVLVRDTPAYQNKRNR